MAVEEGEDAVDVPYTILAYGSGISCGVLGDGDGTVVYSQATSLAAELDPTFEATSDGSGTNTSQIIEGENCTLFKLYSVGHNDFGENVNGTPKKIHPESTISGEWNQKREWYYQKIREKLTQ